MPQIRKFEKIDNFSVFQGFDWNINLSYTDTQGRNQTYDFKDINIFYGRNYSGKTSLSKIIRCLEKKVLPPKYSNPSFLIQCESSSFNQNQISSFNHSIHVYNSDFVKENLRFIHNEEDHIESFNVTLGGDNQQILDRIQILKNELGSNEANTLSGLYLERKNKVNTYETAKALFQTKEDALNNLLSNKATKGQNSIKYQPEKFGDQNYNIQKLKTQDIPYVLNPSYSALTNDTRNAYEQLILQNKKNDPPVPPQFNINFPNLVKFVKDILSIQVGQSSKIEELVKNGSLNKWVEDGLHHHKEKEKCSFCSGEIRTERLDILRQHFDEESQHLKNRIEKGIILLTQNLEKINFSFDLNIYYDNFYENLSTLKSNLDSLSDQIKESINKLINCLEQKKEMLFSQMGFVPPADYSNSVQSILEQLNIIRNQHIQLTTELDSKQKLAQKELRLDHVYQFLQSIDYLKGQEEIDTLRLAIEPHAIAAKSIEKQIAQNLYKTKIEENKLTSETEACTRINSILNHDFGHQSLKLEPIEIDTTGGKIFKFEIQRNGSKAHNLSEGECSLICFCYFLAKIQDDLAEDKKPIIWIDDPICSLDSNHIFFIFSLIEDKICKQRKYKQLFISTHNLEFLKYLRRITGAESDRSIGFAAEANRKASYYLIQRLGSISTIREMPIYLSKFLTEFNYLFDQIYRCATATHIDDSTHHLFYNFGNNARKFLEIYTFYKFPSPKYSLDKQLIDFWGEDIHKNLTDRIHNEYSHMCGVLERGGSITDQPEMQKSAKAIIYKIQNDISQYNAFLESIDVEIANDLLHPDNQPSL